MSCCKWWDKNQDKCIHPQAPQNGDCDWYYDDACPYNEQVSEQKETEELDIYPKCPHCQCDIEYCDELSNDYDDAYYFVSWSGFCPQCQRTFSFSETFRLTERRFLDEEDNC